MAGKITYYCLCLVAMCIWSCTKTPDTLNKITLHTMENTAFTFNEVEKHTVSVITFFSPDCPLSENYTKNLNDLQTEYANQDVLFISVVPGKFYSNQAIDSFRVLYRLQGMLLIDRDKILTDYLGATITPETFVLDSTAAVRYSGAIDNWAVDLGQKREVITKFYLHDAIEATLHDNAVVVTHADAVGCYIE